MSHQLICLLPAISCILLASCFLPARLFPAPAGQTPTSYPTFYRLVCLLLACLYHQACFPKWPHVPWPGSVTATDQILIYGIYFTNNQTLTHTKMAFSPCVSLVLNLSLARNLSYSHLQCITVIPLYYTSIYLSQYHGPIFHP